MVIIFVENDEDTIAVMSTTENAIRTYIAAVNMLSMHVNLVGLTMISGRRVDTKFSTDAVVMLSSLQ